MDDDVVQRLGGELVAVGERHRAVRKAHQHHRHALEGGRSSGVEHRRNLAHFRGNEKPQQVVDVDSDVVYGTESGELRVGSPSAQRHGSGTGIDLDGQHLPDVTVGDDLPSFLEAGVVTGLEVHTKLHRGSRACIDHALRRGGIRRQGLVAEHVLASFGGGNRLFRVESVGRGDRDDVYARVRQHGGKVRRREGGVVPLRERLGAIRVAADGRHKAAIRIRSNCRSDQRVGRSAQADDAPSQCHRSPPCIMDRHRTPRPDRGPAGHVLPAPDRSSCRDTWPSRDRLPWRSRTPRGVLGSARVRLRTACRFD